MNGNKELKIALVAVLGVAVLCLTVAYAALSASLTVTGSGTVKAGSWNVAFEGSTITGTKAGSANCPNATASGSSVSIGTGLTLSKPGDSCQYNLTIKNNGDINAKLTSITPGTPTPSLTSADDNTTAGNYTEYIKYTITYNAQPVTNGVSSITDLTLNSGLSKAVIIKLEFLGTATTVPAQAISIGGLDTTFSYSAA